MVTNTDIQLIRYRVSVVVTHLIVSIPTSNIIGSTASLYSGYVSS